MTPNYLLVARALARIIGFREQSNQKPNIDPVRIQYCNHGNNQTNGNHPGPVTIHVQAEPL